MALMICVAGTSFVCAYIGRLVRLAEVERENIDYLVSRGARVRLNTENSGEVHLSTRVVEVTLYDRTLEPGLARRLSECKDLHTLEMPNCFVADADVRRLQEIPALRRLQVYHLAVTPSTFHELQRMRLMFLEVLRPGPTMEELHQFDESLPDTKIAWPVQ
jgi:hypothetical protein